MKDFSIAMALVDYIPVIFFGQGAAILMQCLYNKMTKASFSLFAAGSINVFMAGFLKATYKLLYAAIYPRDLATGVGFLFSVSHEGGCESFILWGSIEAIISLSFII